MLIPVILSGGAGTRLWPVSREAHPKPFMRLPDGEGLLQKTVLRSLNIEDVHQTLTITNREYYFHTRDEYAALNTGKAAGFDYLLEPCGRNTAPAIAMAAHYLQDAYGADAIMLVLPADHVINNQKSFNLAVAEAVTLAQQGKLVTFGIQPDRPETGFGYIQKGEVLAGNASQVSCFVEKPDLSKAEEYLASGQYLWNSGMFCFQPQTFLAALQEHAPDIYQGTQTCWDATQRDVQPVELDHDSFAAVPSNSIDYAVMEKASDVAVVACDFDWSDVGSWDAVSNLAESDDEGNRIDGDAMLIDSSNCYVHTEGRLVSVLGVDNLVIIDTPDALLIADRNKSQEVKKIVEKLKADNHDAYRYHSTVHRPWGTYTVLEEGNRFKIKRIEVKPGATLSLQMHHHRSEHWIVVSGTAEVVNGDQTFMVHTDESTYVPAGNKHRLSNPGIVNLVMIEVQTGEYLGEDDIVRFDDLYGRN
jgi:mannose-1-phosphate guanylyltransferase/mannose-6-phosphate isomerase